jgi:tetratricopeptide (TPR) repeat protein
VTEEAEGLESPPGSAAANPAAMALGLGAASRDKADAFLDEQRRMLHLQMEEMRADHPYKLSHHRLRRFSDWAKAAFEFSAGLLALALAAGLSYLVWNAANSNDLVIDAFAAPPGLAERGLTGPVIAAKLSDRIAAMQGETISARAPKSYANGLSEGLKLEIPETGVSLSELDRFLREKLGRDQHIGGEIVQTMGGIALTARVGSDGSATVTGAEPEMEALLQKLAEQIYRTTQPYRYGVWLQLHGRYDEAIAVLKPLATSGPIGERAWAYNGWAVNTIQRESERAGLALLRLGFALDPNLYLPIGNISASERRLGREEEGARDVGVAMALLKAHGRDYTTPDRIEGGQHNYLALSLRHQGAFSQALEEIRLSLAAARGANAYGALSLRAEALCGLHEPGAARAALGERLPLAAGGNQIPLSVPSLAIAVEEQDWPGVLIAEKEFRSVTAVMPGVAEDKSTMADPSIAIALAHLGRFAEAQARLKAMPADCYPCLIARAQVAALQGQKERADFWFARAVAAAPTAPFANTEWGEALLARGKPDEAIAHFTLANRIGPHFADPLEGWGEALMAKNQSHLALAKFAEAEKFAPNWGRLHLKWGEALAYAGKPAEARAQFARAAALDLTPSEKTELAKVAHG